MNQGEFTGVFCARPQNFAWFLGAGASRAAGLPTATDILWDMKRRYYCQQENQEITRHDVQNPTVRERIQSYFDSRGFPPHGAANEYSDYFEKIFRDDKERQRRYVKAILAEEQVTLSVGNRVLGALLAFGLSRAAFTTNFDTVVERAVAEVAGKSVSAYHLEGSSAARQALNNEEFPLYCKLHGDFRYDSIKNLSADLATQNAALSECLVNAANRFGFVVAGYSGRDASIMALFREVLNSHNPFPHGLFWLGMRGSPVLPAITELLENATQRGVTAMLVEIETFDALMLRLWRNIESKPAALDAHVRKARVMTVDILQLLGALPRQAEQLDVAPAFGQQAIGVDKDVAVHIPGPHRHHSHSSAQGNGGRPGCTLSSTLTTNSSSTMPSVSSSATFWACSALAR